MKLKDALSLQEGLDPSIVQDIVDIAVRSEFGSISGMDKVAEQEWEDISQLIRYIKEAIPTTTHYRFDTLVSKLEDRLPDTEIAQNLNENEAKFKRGDEVDYLGKKGKVRSAKFNPFDKSFDYTIAYIDQGVRTSSDGVKDRDLKEKIKEYGLPGNVGREFGEKYIRTLIESGKFAELWTAFEATYPKLQPKLQATFEKSNDLLRYIKPEKGSETYRVSSIPEAAAQELDTLLYDVVELIEHISSLSKTPNKEVVEHVIRDVDNTLTDMLMIFTSNTDSDKPLNPYKQSDIGFKENKTMKTKIKLLEIYASGHKETTSDKIGDFKEFQLAWRNLDSDQREELLLVYIAPEQIKDIPTMEWEQLWHNKPNLANDPDFQEALLAANFGGNGSVNEVLPRVKDDDMEEGTCGYSVDGEGGDKPAGSHLLRKSDLKESEIRKMIKKQIKEIKDPSSKSTKLTDLIKESSFDDRLKAKMGMSDDEFEKNVTSRDIGSPFPGEPVKATKASKLIDNIKLSYKNMSEDEMESFSKEMVEYFLDQSIAAQAAAKVFFGKKMGPDPADDPHGQELPF